MNKLTKTLTGLMAAVCMVTSTTAHAADMSDEIKNLAGNKPEATVTNNGVTIDVQKTMMDEHSIYVLYDITIPENMQFNDSIQWESEQLVVSTQESSSSASPRIISQDKNKRTVLHRYCQNSPITGNTIAFTLSNLSYTENCDPYDIDGIYDAAGKPVQSNTRTVTWLKGDWNLKWTANKETSIIQEPNQSVKLNGLDGVSYQTMLRKITVSPFSMCMLFESKGNYVAAPIIRLKDGTTVPYNTQENQTQSGYTDFSDPSNPKTFVLQPIYFNSLIQANQVESVTIGDVTIPMGTTENTSNTPSPWAMESVNQAVALNIIPAQLQQNYTQATTRAEFCAMAVKLYETVTGTTIAERKQFSDTSDEHVQKLAGLGVVDGVGDGKFDPNQQVSRQQAATMLSRLANAIGKPLPSGAANFSDNASIAPWALDAVGAVSASNIMSGVGDNTFAPQGLYTREQSIITMLRLYHAMT